MALNENLSRGHVGMIGRFLHGQDRCEADIGALHDLAPVVAGFALFVVGAGRVVGGLKTVFSPSSSLSRSSRPRRIIRAGSVVASDAFFPFRDGLDVVADNGAVAVIQPGGSVRDQEVIAAADERGLAMVFTGIRHFRH